MGRNLFLLLLLLLLPAVVFATEVLRPCCSKDFGNTERCLDLPRDICCLLNGTIPERYKSKACATDPCKKSCGNGIVEPWEDCDGGKGCSPKCRSENGTCCAYPDGGDKDEYTNLTRDECTPIDVPMYWANENETCEEEPPDRAYCRSSNTCCECGKNVRIMARRDSVSSGSEILIFIALAFFAFLVGLLIPFVLWYFGD